MSHVYDGGSHLSEWTKVSYWVSGGCCAVLPKTLIILERSKWELTWFNDFSSRVLDNNLPPIQVFDQKLAATQRLHQPDLVVYEQVISISLEGLKMRKTRVLFFCSLLKTHLWIRSLIRKPEAALGWHRRWECAPWWMQLQLPTKMKWLLKSLSREEEPLCRLLQWINWCV